MPKSKPLHILMSGRYKLAYSKKRDDKRIYGLYIFKPHFLDILATRCTKDIEEAKNRVIITQGKYVYHPSDEYMKLFMNYRHYKSFKINTNGQSTKRT